MKKLELVCCGYQTGPSLFLICNTNYWKRQQALLKNTMGRQCSKFAKNYLDQSPHGIQIFWAFSDFLNVLRLSDLLIFSELTHIFWATSNLLSYLRFSELPQIFWATTDLWATSDFLTYLRFSEFLLGFSELAQIFWDC